MSIYDNALLDRYFIFIVYYIIGDVLAIVFKQIVEAELKSVYANIASDFSWRVVNLLFLAGMMMFGIGFEAYFYFTIFSVFIRFLLLLVPVIPRVDLRVIRFDFATKEFRRDFVQYCLFTTFAGAAGLVNASIDKLMIGFYVDLEAVGVYTIARSLSAVVRAPETALHASPRRSSRGTGRTTRRRRSSDCTGRARACSCSSAESSSPCSQVSPCRCFGSWAMCT